MPVKPRTFLPGDEVHYWHRDQAGTEKRLGRVVGMRPGPTVTTTYVLVELIGAGGVPSEQLLLRSDRVFRTRATVVAERRESALIGARAAASVFYGTPVVFADIAEGQRFTFPNHPDLVFVKMTRGRFEDEKGARFKTGSKTAVRPVVEIPSSR